MDYADMSAVSVLIGGKLVCGSLQRAYYVEICYRRVVVRDILVAGPLAADRRARDEQVAAGDLKVDAAARAYADKRIRAAHDKLLHRDSRRGTSDTG